MTKNEFKTYTGTKTVKAMQMLPHAAKANGANITEETVEKHSGEAGYLVEYNDGYRSWCPAKVFEEAYNLSETYIDRMKIELKELTERICKGMAAYYTPGKIDNDDWYPLGYQLDAMREYAKFLYERIRVAEIKRKNNDETL